MLTALFAATIALATPATPATPDRTIVLSTLDVSITEGTTYSESDEHYTYSVTVKEICIAGECLEASDIERYTTPATPAL